MAHVTDAEIDQLVEIITSRVQARLGGGAAGALAPAAGDPTATCNCQNDDDACNGCGYCVVRKPWSVRAMEAAGAQRVGAKAGVGPVTTDMAGMIDHTLLRPDAQREDIVKLCQEARQYKFASVCVNSSWVPVAKSQLAGSQIMVCAVVGFPLGAMTPTAKAYEAREAVRQGAREIDMVINVGALKSGDYDTVFEDIHRVVKASVPSAVKVILECSALTDEEKVIGCALSKLAGAAFVKTSTGFGKGGATVEDVALMRRVVGAEMGVKASGGIHSAEDVQRMAAAGATRIGASASVAIVSGKPSSSAKRGGY